MSQRIYSERTAGGLRGESYKESLDFGEGQTLE
jgi:hypothetical protein